MSSPISAIAFDYGTKNIGIAYGQSLTRSSQALCIIKARDGIPNWDEVSTIVEQWQPTHLVVGLPLNMDGSDSELTRRARKFGNRLRARTRLELSFVDERLSSQEARSYARDLQGHTGNYGRSPIDALAACVILQSFWAQIPEALV